MNVFNIKSVLLERHAQHVVLIHFPIALFLVSVAFDFLAQWTRKTALAAVARYNLLVAAISSLPAVATGLLAWRWQFEGVQPEGILLLHLVLGVVSTCLIWLVWWLHFRPGRKLRHFLPLYRLPIEVATAIAIVLTAHLGGFLTGIN